MLNIFKTDRGSNTGTEQEILQKSSGRKVSGSKFDRAIGYPNYFQALSQSFRRIQH